jgi:hypothetical protein
VARNSLDLRSLDCLLDELDEASDRDIQKLDEGSPRGCRRRHPRKACRRDCLVRYMMARGGRIFCMKGRMRNLSRNGLSVLVRRVFGPHEPVEVELTLPDGPRMFMGGLVQFCRYVGQGYNELGVDLKAAAAEPIFSTNPVLAVRVLDWLNPDVRQR